jgi:hypothetical protein
MTDQELIFSAVREVGLFIADFSNRARVTLMQ